MPTRQLERVAAAAGLAFVGLLVVARRIVPAPVLPEMQAGGLVRSYYLEHETGLGVQGGLVGLASVFGLLFLAALYRTLRRESQLPWLAPVVVTSAGVALGLLLSSTAVLAALVDFRQAEVLGATGGSGGGAVALFQLHVALDQVMTFPLAGLLAGASAAALSCRSLPAWFSWSGLVLAPATLLERLVPAFDLGTARYGFLLWVAAASVLLVMEAQDSNAEQPVS